MISLLFLAASTEQLPERKVALTQDLFVTVILTTQPTWVAHL